MVKYIRREFRGIVENALKRSPCVALLGPRQCGKSTFAKEYLKDKDAIYLDLQLPSNRNKLSDPELFFQNFQDKLICIDEIQLAPNLFSVLRSIIDHDRREGRFIFLGSASRDLIQQSNETLAGRIAFIEMSPFLWSEIKNDYDFNDFLLKGGFPESLRHDNENSYDWRVDFISTFLERDLPSIGLNVPAPIMHRLWMMLAHYHGQVLNLNKLCNSLDIKSNKLKTYIGILEQTFVLRALPPFHSNLKKRIVKSPKYYIRDHGVLHALLGITNFEELMGHPVIGASWEGLVLEHLIIKNKRWEPSYIRTSNQAEVDLVLTRGNKIVFVECKYSKSPQKSRGLTNLINELKPDLTLIVCPISESYELEKNVKVVGLLEAVDEIEKL